MCFVWMSPHRVNQFELICPFELKMQFFNNNSQGNVSNWWLGYHLWNSLMWLSLDLIDDESTLVQVMAWCRQTTSHCLDRCWLRFLSPFGLTRPQWKGVVNLYLNMFIPLDCVYLCHSVVKLRFRLHSQKQEKIITPTVNKICFIFIQNIDIQDSKIHKGFLLTGIEYG